MTSSEEAVDQARRAVLWAVRGCEKHGEAECAACNEALDAFEAAVRRDALTAVRDSDQAAADFGRNER